MKTDVIKYILIYLLIYVVMVIGYGVLQNYYVCTDMNGFTCNFNEQKLLNFLTVVSYILTPLVAIIGFLSWKNQHNKHIQNEIIQTAINELNFCRVQLDCFILNLFSNSEINPKECDKIPETINPQLFLRVDSSFHDYIKSFYMSTSALDVALNSFHNSFKKYDKETGTYHYEIKTIQQYMEISYKIKNLGQIILHEYQSHYLDTSNEEFERYVLNTAYHSEDLRIYHDQIISYLHENNKA
ncbi:MULTISPECIES: hypothetical protein [Acinetobacter]|uniref:DUF4760 domain-containing protein n=1 Tax=Acinetobacter piscicola TaxID=2006115 RepID=A0A7S6VT48_9GAMM|nr:MULTISPECIES: hypothetical protein [Acinetobacter]QOW44425.1 hypothetical protein G0028_16910 [Acinetobacter piscicola]